MHYDAVIIGAGMSGLAAGIRLAMYDRRVCILERHYAFGGLNSYYRIDGREYDVGLHALTNYVPPGVRNAPLPKLLRQLRLTRDDFDLREQHGSRIVFPGRSLRFTNDLAVLTEEVAREFPREVDGFRRLVELVRTREYDVVDAGAASARAVLADYLRDPVLIDMILCPIMFYGSPTPRDVDFAYFSILFRSLFCEGFARPPGGVRTIIKALVRRFRECGGKLRMNTGVARIEIADNRATAIHLANGETLSADLVISCAGSFETMRLCGRAPAAPPDLAHRLTFVESITVLPALPAAVGLPETITFFNFGERFVYDRPTDDCVDDRSGVLCCPNNYDGHEGLTEGVVRLTALADYGRWAAMDEPAYRRAKDEVYDRLLGRARQLGLRYDGPPLAKDVFTPRTIERFTGHMGGAVYGSPTKIGDGRTGVENLFLCGTDTGLVGIIGTLLSGVMIANAHGLEETPKRGNAETPKSQNAKTPT
jgi:phytoene dehydrogenase-like protein